MGVTGKEKSAKREVSQIKTALIVMLRHLGPKDNKERTSGFHMGMQLEWGKTGDKMSYEVVQK